MSQPTLLDAYCCAGGMTRGYQRAGCRVTGVDIKPQPNYIGDDFVQADAVAFIREHGRKFDMISASPPCQDGCATTKGNRTRAGWVDTHVNLIPVTRDALLSTGRPFVIENTPGNKDRLATPITLCGEMFGLGVIRHRYFELGRWATTPPVHLRHRGRVRGWRHGEYFNGPYVAVYGRGGGKASAMEAQTAMGIDWTDDPDELNQMIPPDYAQSIGERWIEQRNQGAQDG